VTAYRFGLLALAFVACGAFSTDGAGRACVAHAGERGVAYDIHRTKAIDAYGPGGRRLVDNGYRVYQIEVPPLTKWEKPITCMMRLGDTGWRPFDFTGTGSSVPPFLKKPRAETDPFGSDTLGLPGEPGALSSPGRLAPDSR
jgi:hypothetical protein